MDCTKLAASLFPLTVLFPTVDSHLQLVFAALLQADQPLIPSILHQRVAWFYATILVVFFWTRITLLI